MPGKTKKQAAEPAKETPKEPIKQAPPEIAEVKEIFFVCKFCGKPKPLGELIMIRHLYPQVSSCKECARVTKNPSSEPTDEGSEQHQPEQP
jgi:hypothetical protein